MRRPTASEFWSFAQRYLAFDDPTDWWNRLLELAARHSNQTTKSLSSLPLDKQLDLMSSMYGAPESETALSLFNTILGVDIMQRWQPQALDVWALPFASENSSLATENLPPLQAVQRRWISAIQRININWRRVLEDEGGRNDPRSAFIAKFLADLHTDPVAASCFVWSDWLQQQFRKQLAAFRKDLPVSFLPNMLMLVEGPTEVLLLPHFAARSGFDFNHHGVNIVPAGGANQVLRKYFDAREILAIPIVAVLDADAEEHAEMLYESLRPQDRMFVFTSGEIEDAIDISSLLSTINHYLANHGSTLQMQLGDLNQSGRRTTVLNRWWRQNGLGDFDKIGLAETLKARDLKDSAVPPEIKALVDIVKTVAAGSLG
jgi:hypothetical protein